MRPRCFFIILFFSRAVSAGKKAEISRVGREARCPGLEQAATLSAGRKWATREGSVSPNRPADKVRQLLWPSLRFLLWLCWLENLTAVLPLRYESQRL